MKKGLIINEDAWPLIDELEPEEKVELLDALAAAYRGQPAPEMSRIVTVVYKKILADNDRFNAERQDLSEIRRAAGKKGAEARWQNMANIANDGKNGEIRKDKNRKDIYNTPFAIQRNPKVQAAMGFSTERQDVDYNKIAWEKMWEEG